MFVLMMRGFKTNAISSLARSLFLKDRIQARKGKSKTHFLNVLLDLNGRQNTHFVRNLLILTKPTFHLF